MLTFYQITSFLKHKLYEINEHSLHSPYLFNLYQDCFKVAKKMPCDEDIEALRMMFQQDDTLVDIVDYGAGSKLTGKTNRTIRSVANGGISTSKYSKLFQQLIWYFNCKNIVELGTSLGINTLYLARAAEEVNVWTFEGCSSIADFADRIFSGLGCANIEIVKGNIDDTLPEYLMKIPNIDFAFFDANHTHHATIDYFNQIVSKLSDKSIVVIDDIYWSKEMTCAWKDILKRFPEATSIDIYYCGIIIFDKTIPAEGLRFEY